MEDKGPPDNIERRSANEQRAGYRDRRSGSDRREEQREAMRNEIRQMAILPVIMKPVTSRLGRFWRWFRKRFTSLDDQ